MNTVDFYPTEFQNIPEQDNPAHGKERCRMIVGAHDCDKARVLFVNPGAEFGVVPVCDFWVHPDALEYCEMLEDKDKETTDR
jgi:hypothetical protein